MKKIVLTLVLVVAAVPAAQAGPAGAGPATAAKPRKQAVADGFFRGQTVRYFDFGPIKLERGNKLAPLWTVTNGPKAQHNIIDTVPGKRDYSPLWQVNKVTWKDGVTPRVLRSAAAVKQARQQGDVTVERTATVVNCPVLGFGQKRVPGFSGGHLIHYYDLGPVKVAPGNEVVLLYAPTNGVTGQHNITRETIARGQTAYPPLWRIVQVTWNAGAQKRLLTSFAAVQKAKSAGAVTLKKTTLVVNCPIVP